MIYPPPPRLQITHKPTGLRVVVGRGYSKSLHACKAMALRLIRSMLAGPKPKTHPRLDLVRTYDLGRPGTPPVLIRDRKTGVETSDVAAVLDQGHIESFILARLRSDREDHA